MKIILLAFLFLLSGPDVSSQDQRIEESNEDPTRPAENELLLNEQTPGGTPESELETNNFPGVSLGDFLRVILILGVIIALIYALVWMLKKLTGIKADSGDEISIYSTRPIKGNSALHLMGVGERIFLIGSTDNSINLISEIDDKETIDEIRLNSSKMPARGGFAKLLKERFSGKSPERTEGARTIKMDDYSADSSILNLQKQRERLKDL